MTWSEWLGYLLGVMAYYLLRDKLIHTKWKDMKRAKGHKVKESRRDMVKPRKEPPQPTEKSERILEPKVVEETVDPMKTKDSSPKKKRSQLGVLSSQSEEIGVKTARLIESDQSVAENLLASGSKTPDVASPLDKDLGGTLPIPPPVRPPVFDETSIPSSQPGSKDKTHIEMADSLATQKTTTTDGQSTVSGGTTGGKSGGSSGSGVLDEKAGEKKKKKKKKGIKKEKNKKSSASGSPAPVPEKNTDVQKKKPTMDNQPETGVTTARLLEPVQNAPERVYLCGAKTPDAAPVPVPSQPAGPPASESAYFAQPVAAAPITNGNPLVPAGLKSPEEQAAVAPPAAVATAAPEQKTTTTTANTEEQSAMSGVTTGGKSGVSDEKAGEKKKKKKKKETKKKKPSTGAVPGAPAAPTAAVPQSTETPGEKQVTKKSGKSSKTDDKKVKKKVSKNRTKQSTGQLK